MSLEAELNELGAPRDVVDAGKRIDQYADAKLRPPRDLVGFVYDWVGRSQAQNRWGK